jgi:hypothetical protein
MQKHKWEKYKSLTNRLMTLEPTKEKAYVRIFETMTQVSTRSLWPKWMIWEPTFELDKDRWTGFLSLERNNTECTPCGWLASDKAHHFRVNIDRDRKALTKLDITWMVHSLENNDWTSIFPKVSQSNALKACEIETTRWNTSSLIQDPEACERTTRIHDDGTILLSGTHSLKWMVQRWAWFDKLMWWHISSTRLLWVEICGRIHFEYIPT